MKTTPLSIWTAQALPATGVVNSNPISLYQVFLYAVQVTWTGTPTGALTLEGSCDTGSISPSGVVTGVSHWTTITSTSTSTGGAAGSVLYNMPDTAYVWVRLVYTASSGTGSAIAHFTTKGV